MSKQLILYSELEQQMTYSMLCLILAVRFRQITMDDFRSTEGVCSLLRIMRAKKTFGSTA